MANKLKYDSAVPNHSQYKYWLQKFPAKSTRPQQILLRSQLIATSELKAPTKIS